MDKITDRVAPLSSLSWRKPEIRYSNFRNITNINQQDITNNKQQSRLILSCPGPSRPGLHRACHFPTTSIFANSRSTISCTFYVEIATTYNSSQRHHKHSQTTYYFLGMHPPGFHRPDIATWHANQGGGRESRGENHVRAILTSSRALSVYLTAHG